MKTSRVITLVLVAVTTLLCCFPVAALDVANSYSYSNVIDNSLTQYLNVSVMYADDESYAYGTDSDVVQYYDAPTYQALVNYRVKNTSDQDANLNVSYIALDFGLQASGYNVIGVEYVSGALEPYYVSISDFRLQQIDGTSTTVIVPAGGYISGTFIIHLQETYDNSSGTHIQYPAFSNFNTWDTFSPTYGNYNSTVLDYVSDVYVELLDQGVSLDEIVSILSASLVPNDFNISGFYQQSYQSGSVCPMVVHAYSTGGYLISEYSDLHNVDTSHNYLVKVPLYYFFGFSNPFSDQDYEFTGSLGQFYMNIKPVINTGFNYAGYDLKIESEYFYIYDYLANGNIYFRFKDNPYIVKSGACTFGILEYDYYFYFDELTDASSFVSSINFGVTLNSYPVRIYNTDVEDIVEEQHEQEAQYYSDTNTALQNSGLPDYNFNSQQTGGLSGVSDDFVRVWNACGALNSVFVFSLTLSLALYILRHRRRL